MILSKKRRLRVNDSSPGNNTSVMCVIGLSGCGACAFFAFFSRDFCDFFGRGFTVVTASATDFSSEPSTTAPCVVIVFGLGVIVAEAVIAWGKIAFCVVVVVGGLVVIVMVVADATMVIIKFNFA